MTSAGDSQKANNDGASRDIRSANILAATAVADVVRTSLGPKGMDKMIQSPQGEVTITNDGATIVRQMQLSHPCAKMMVDLSKSQDIEAGDGTTSVVVTAGSLLKAAEMLLGRGIHPQVITEAFLMAEEKAVQLLWEMSTPIKLTDRETLIKNASTSLNSKVVGGASDVLAPIATDAVLKVIESSEATNVDLNDIRIVQKLGGTIEDAELVDGLVLPNKVARIAGGPTRITNAKIGLIQFCLSPPKTDMEQNVTVKDYSQMDRILREERMIVAKMVKQIAATGCNVLLVQKSILRDAVTDLSLDFCAKCKILVVRDVEREDIDFVSRILGCEPVAALENFTKDKLGAAETVFDDNLGVTGQSGVVRFCGIQSAIDRKCVSILVRGSSQLLLDETERSIHDALCVVRSLVKMKALIAGGAAAEMELSTKLQKWGQTLKGAEAICIQAYGEALEVIPYTLAENAGLQPIEIVSKLRQFHNTGKQNSGINVVKRDVEADMTDIEVVQPLLVSASIIKMATETVRLILKIDDIVMTR